MHYAASSTNYEAIYTLAKFAREKQGESDQDIDEWVNSKTHIHNYTPLMIAAQQSHFKTIQALIDNNADCQYKTQIGMNVLHAGAKEDAAKSIIVFVKEKGMDINKQDYFGFTPLHYAVKQFKEISIKYLLALKANPNI